MRLFDSHCHLQDERLASNPDGLRARAERAGVRALLCCGSEETDWPGVAQLASSQPGVIPAFGLHPWYVNARSPQWDKALRQQLDATPSAVGEIGLDHAVEPRNDAEQERVFLRQLEISIERRLPVSIHCRRAWGRLVELLKTYGPHPVGLCIHSYSGGPELVAPLADLGVFFSFSGTLTRSGNRKGHRAAAAAPIDRLLIETDAPDLPPVGAASEINEPSNLPLVLEALARIRGAGVEDMARQTWDNAVRLFGPLRPAFFQCLDLSAWAEKDV